MAGYLGAIPVPQATQHRESFTATSGQTTFNTAGYTVGFLDVYLNGSHLSPADFTATNGSDVVLASGASADDVCDIISYTAFEVNSQTFTGGLDVTGGITADGLTVDATESYINGRLRLESGANSQDLRFSDTSTTDQNAQLRLSSGSLLMQSQNNAFSGATTRASFANNGDISFYEDTGTTAKLFWDASAESLGIGTSTPAAELHINQSGGTPEIRLSDGTHAAMFNMDTVAHIGSVTSVGLAFDINSTEEMRLTSTGLGIGTSSPSVPLHINIGTDNNALYIQSSDQFANIGLIDGSGSGKIIMDSGELSFTTGGDATTSFTGSTERMRIDSSGNLLVGTTDGNPTGNHVPGTVINATGSINVHRDGGNPLRVGSSVDGNLTEYYKQGALVGSISVSGSSTAYNTSSDYRLKTDAQPMTGASDRVLALNPVNFEWIADGTRVDGFLAHEAQAVVPESVTGTKDAMMDEEYEVSAATGDIYTPATNAYVDEDGNDVDAVDEVIHSADVEQPETLEDGKQWRETTAAVMGTRSVPDMQGIDQSKLVPLLVASLQEALARITALENA